jgi:hypothetical protein
MEEVHESITGEYIKKLVAISTEPLSWGNRSLAGQRLAYMKVS